MAEQNVAIDESWKELLKEEFTSPYFAELKSFLVEERKLHTVYPPGGLIFNAFNKTPVNKVKVVILGQDPYHGAGQAHGLCFSVQQGIKPPPSLVNIYKELNSDIGFKIPTHGCLEKWADEGILLLNATLTVRANTPRSHFNHGWEKFTDAAIRNLCNSRENLVFLLWGNDAKLKLPLIDAKKHQIFTSVHPSPFSARDGFFGCRHFSKTNEFLKSKGIAPIDWQV